MNLKTLLATVLVASAPLPALAAITLDFEGVTSFASINDFYNGGTDSAGASGTNYSVSFTGAALALQNDALGPYFSNAPTPGTVMFASPDSPAILNFDAGFNGLLQFYYSSTVAAFDEVKVYSGLNGTGALLFSIGVNNNAQLGCSDSPFCHFDAVSILFPTLAKSIDFSANAGLVAFDNITLSPVPEPTGIALMLAGFGLVGAIARRRSRG